MPGRAKRLCRSKVRYRDELGAMLALAKIDRSGKTERRAYRCPHCGGWHLTSQERKK